MKFLLLVLVIAIAYWIFKSYSRKIRRGPGRRPDSTSEEDMVRCAECGVHLPRSESLMSGEAFYCSAEHRRLHQHAD